MINKKLYAADFVTRLPVLSIKLEDGTQCQFQWSKEVAVPDDTLGQRREYSRIPAQLAFWAYQTERALREVRSLEKALAAKEGEMNLVYRRWYTTEKQEEYTEGQIRSRVDTDATVGEARDLLNSARGMYGTIRALRDAVESRAHVLRQLLHVPSGTS